MISNTILTEVNVGPFAPLVGYVGAIVSAIYLISILTWGRKQSWMSDGDELPNVTKKIVAVLSGISLVAIWLYSTPATLWTVIYIAIITGIILLICFIFYSFIKSNNSYYDPKVNDKILGGFKLTEKASSLRQGGKNLEAILSGAKSPEQVWTKNSISAVKTLLLSLYLVIMISGTVAFVAVGCAVQVRLTGKPAAMVISKNDAPGIENNKNQK